jgi:hypothetical protein
MRGTDCEAHAHDSTIPQQKHHVQPLSRGGDPKQKLAVLCSNAHDEVHYFLDAIEREAKGLMALAAGPIDLMAPVMAIPGRQRVTYGGGIRAVAVRGWQMYGAAFLAGRFKREATLWRTSGDPIVPGIPPFSVAVDMATRGVAGADRDAHPEYLAWLASRFPAWRRLGLR